MIEITGLAANTWHNVYVSAGISVGAAIAIYNKSASPLLLWEGVDAPPNANSGIPLGLDEPIMVADGSPGVWVRGMIIAAINVQEVS